MNRSHKSRARLTGQGPPVRFHEYARHNYATLTAQALQRRTLPLAKAHYSSFAYDFTIVLVESEPALLHDHLPCGAGTRASMGGRFRLMSLLGAERLHIFFGQAVTNAHAEPNMVTDAR